VRLRIDGSLVGAADVPPTLAPAVVSRLKLLGGLALDERRLPQDGRARVRLEGRDLDLRISSVPTEHGESLAVRLLEPEAPRRGLAELGLDADDEAVLRRALRAGDGLVLVTGPTGAGKTTTLYACLHELNRPGRKILTVEDPVEYRLPGVSQVAVHPAGGMTFAAALRAFLRQAPNVVMVGEIRDAETAALALHAALTGHLVLSTLHTGDAVGAVARLLDLGARPALVAAALRATVAQRLVRRVCGDCSRPVPLAAHEAAALGLGPAEAAGAALRRGAGCAACGGTGHRGRVGVFEVLPCDDALRARIAAGAGPAELRAAATAAGWRPLAGSAGRKVLAGATTIDEFLAITAGRPADPNAFPP
jgi:general secretion pathway protein E/type IV pilus assembly protein PilB